MEAPPITRTTVRARVLGCPVDIVDMATAVQTLVEIVQRRRADETSHPGVVITLNPEMVMMARRSSEFSSVLESAALVVPDGVGLVRALRRRGHPEVERVGGADLIHAYLQEAERHSHTDRAGRWGARRRPRRARSHGREAPGPQRRRGQ